MSGPSLTHLIPPLKPSVSPLTIQEEKNGNPNEVNTIGNTTHKICQSYLKCAISNNWTDHPVELKTCGHIFDQVKIHNWFVSMGGTYCPAKGCNKPASVRDL
ncbi:MAG: hypothetical protein JSR46_05405, partial [Verrucomicrobia bacterium]|nr:hypothetical protein [Verrucomicrobiota bacterium]